MPKFGTLPVPLRWQLAACSAVRAMNRVSDIADSDGIAAGGVGFACADRRVVTQDWRIGAKARELVVCGEIQSGFKISSGNDASCVTGTAWRRLVRVAINLRMAGVHPGRPPIARKVCFFAVAVVAGFGAGIWRLCQANARKQHEQRQHQKRRGESSFHKHLPILSGLFLETLLIKTLLGIFLIEIRRCDMTNFDQEFKQQN